MATPEKFKETLLNFLDELVQTYPHVSQFTLAKIFTSGCDSSYLVARTKKKIVPKKEKIKKRDENYFLSNDCDLFSKVEDQNSVNYFQQLWTTMPEENKQVIWDWFDVLLYIAEQC